MSISTGAGDCDDCPLARRTFLRASLAVIGLAWFSDIIPISAAEARETGRRTERRYPLPAADGVMFDKENEVILVRHTGQVYAFALSCPHQNTALKWVDDGGGRFQCPKHKSKYQPDGTFISGRATRSMDRFAIREEGSEVVVDLDRLFRQDKNQSEWEAAVVKLPTT